MLGKLFSRRQTTLPIRTPLPPERLEVPAELNEDDGFWRAFRSACAASSQREVEADLSEQLKMLDGSSSIGYKTVGDRLVLGVFDSQTDLWIYLDGSTTCEGSSRYEGIPPQWVKEEDDSFERAFKRNARIRHVKSRITSQQSKPRVYRGHRSDRIHEMRLEEL